MKLKKNDNVLIIRGKDRNKTGKIQKVMPKFSKIVVTGINVAKKHAKPSRKYPRGGILNITLPIPANNVMIICPNCRKITRVAHKKNKDINLRICKKCGESLDQKS